MLSWQQHTARALTNTTVCCHQDSTRHFVSTPLCQCYASFLAARPNLVLHGQQSSIGNGPKLPNEKHIVGLLLAPLCRAMLRNACTAALADVPFYTAADAVAAAAQGLVVLSCQAVNVCCSISGVHVDLLQVCANIAKLVDTQDGLGSALTATDVANALTVPLAIASEHLLTAEGRGVLCRDDGPEGLRFFRNFFSDSSIGLAA